jgi:histidinol dehydrogenase
MNDIRREKLRKALTLIDKAATIVDGVSDEEQDAIENYPENLQNTEKFEGMEIALDNLNEAVERMDGVKEIIEAAMK